MSIEHTGISRFGRELGLTLSRQEDGSIVGVVTLQLGQEGPPYHVHGGVLCALIDEAMGASVWSTGRRSLAVNLNINYRRPVPLGVELRVTGRIEKIEGRKTFTSGQITLPDGLVATEGTGIFVETSLDALRKARPPFGDPNGSEQD